MELKEGKVSVEQKVIRNFIRVLAALLLVFYVVYMGHQKWTTGDVNLDTSDYSIITASVAVWVAVEAVRAYVVRKLEKKE